MPPYHLNRSNNRPAFVSQMKQEHNQWIQDHTAKCTNLVKVRTLNGIKVAFFDEGTDDSTAQGKFAAALDALTNVSAKFTLPPRMHIYCTSDDTSYGFVDRTSDELQPATGHVLLGKSVTLYRPMEEDEALTIGDTKCKVRGGLTSGGRRLVADQVYEATNGGTAAKQKAALLTCCYHELGHVLHAYDPDSIYYDGQDLKTKLFPGKQRDTYDLSRTYVSEWSLYGSDVVPSEFVAEVFSGLMMGLSFHQLAITFYNMVSGPGVDFAITDVENELVTLA
ncbi:hypothetical protein P2318_05870 [Myxococcaceae bacterium GXIMD 01537]